MFAQKTSIYVAHKPKGVKCSSWTLVVGKRSGSKCKNLLVTIPETSKLLLSGGVPNVHKDGAEVCEKLERMNLDAHGSEVALLKLTGDMALDEGGLPDATIADKDDLKGRDVLGGCRHLYKEGAATLK